MLISIINNPPNPIEFLIKIGMYLLFLILAFLNVVLAAVPYGSYWVIAKLLTGRPPKMGFIDFRCKIPAIIFSGIMLISGLVFLGLKMSIWLGLTWYTVILLIVVAYCLICTLWAFFLARKLEFFASLS